jgi:hypothetical protein
MESIETQIRGLFPQYEDFSKFQLLIADHDDWIKLTVCGGGRDENRKEADYIRSVLEGCGFELIEGSITEGRDYVFCVRKIDFLDNRLEIHSGAMAQLIFCFRPTIANIKGTVKPEYNHFTPTSFMCELNGNEGDCDAVFVEATARLSKLGYDLLRAGPHHFEAKLAKNAERRI